MSHLANSSDSENDIYISLKIIFTKALKSHLSMYIFKFGLLGCDELCQIVHRFQQMLLILKCTGNFLSWTKTGIALHFGWKRLPKIYI